MGMNETPSGERLHIGFFGRRNVGKSSLVNRVTGQELAVVSEVKGTTTDPVKKAMELLPLGPVVIIDTPGIDDEGHLGELRVKKARQVLNRVDVALLVADGTEGLGKTERELLGLFRQKEIPYLIAFNKADLLGPEQREKLLRETEPEGKALLVSARENWQIWELKEAIGQIAGQKGPGKQLVADLLHPSDFVALVIPIDKAAPKGRLILPQQQTIRDILDAGARAVMVREDELAATLKTLGEKPSLVITDSQVFGKVAADTPEEIPLTSFSILFARYKGNLLQAAEGAAFLKKIRTGDRILISEGCTHHRQCGDIGTEKLPAMIRRYTGARPEFVFSSGQEFPEDLAGCRLVIHCGGCMLNEREMKYRLKTAADQGVPMTNYGIAIACMQGILARSVSMFPAVREVLERE
ncbi:MAG TPA: [FeFe] hydrogenase H-cluster maturation GTPase HydF [Candidatus Scatomonas pullistercoris]|uniref:[FeFe] hydrogenase H-cluster maturation GTPase HydF n=1 Tax=Candidatus Scatomonas pullistercoris TaxID=2840920 RepID=A0A9D1P0N6_9FIRM|nr:[FeFe] hydrogenase H-cluster maturation GTPase HydF [Candidatus Scatomonas pullistercoris]